MSRIRATIKARNEQEFRRWGKLTAKRKSDRSDRYGLAKAKERGEVYPNN